MMKIENCWWIKFSFKEGHGIFVKLSLECPVCKMLNTAQTTGFEIGEHRPLPAAAAKIIGEIPAGDYRCRHCGVSSAIVPGEHLQEELQNLKEELTSGFFEKLPASLPPAKIQGIYMN